MDFMHRMFRNLLAGAALLPMLAMAELPAAADLAADARAARGAGAVIVVFFASDSCHYCDQVETLHLEPMHDGRAFGARLMIRKVDIAGGAPLVDFAGRRTRHVAFARAQGVNFTPFLRFFGPDGRELAEPLIGVASADFYGGQLEAAIERALARLGEPVVAGCAPATANC
jgi:thioredoxin-related protein